MTDTPDDLTPTERAALLRAQADELEAGSTPDPIDVATEVVEAVAPAVAEVVANAAPVIDMPDPIDAAAGDAIRMEASSDAEVRRIREEADARIRVIEAEARAAAGIIETAADAAPEPEVVELETEPVQPDPGADDSDPKATRGFLSRWFG